MTNKIHFAEKIYKKLKKYSKNNNNRTAKVN